MKGGNRRGIVILAAALAFYLLTEPGPLDFNWVPLLSGGVYLAAAAAGGKAGGYWAPAAVLCCWGAAVILQAEGIVEEPTGPLYLTAVGIGAVVAAVLDRQGFGVSLLGTATAIVVAGLVFLVAPDYPDVLLRTTPYALAYAAWGIVDLARPG